MSEFKHKENSGSLFRNDKKETDKHPDYKGSALIDSKEFWVSSWINEASNGQKYMAMKFQEKEKAVKAEPITQASEPSGDLPF